MEAIIKAKPAAAKGKYVKSRERLVDDGPGVRVDDNDALSVRETEQLGDGICLLTLVLPSERPGSDWFQAYRGWSWPVRPGTCFLELDYQRESSRAGSHRTSTCATRVARGPAASYTRGQEHGLALSWRSKGRRSTS